MTMQEKRKTIQDLVINTTSLLDPSLANTKKYQAFFTGMNDKQFSDWITKFLADDKSNLRIDIEEFGDGTHSLKFENIKKAANYIGLKLFDYVYIPHVSSNPNRPVRTKTPVLVGHLNIKRPQQFVTKKTGMALNDTNRDDLSGAAKGDTKGGTSTGVENELLSGIGAEEVLSEIIGARGDNEEEYKNMLNSIADNGSVKLADIKTNAYDKPSLLKVDLYFMAMGLKTDLISDSYYSIAKVKSAMNK